MPENITYEVRRVGGGRITCFPERSAADSYADSYTKHGIFNEGEVEVVEYEFVPFEERPKEVCKEHIDAVRKKAWEEHSRDIPADSIIGPITRVDTWEDVEVIEVKVFDKVYRGSPDDYATVEVRYAKEEARAIYGVELDGTPIIYAD